MDPDVEISAMLAHHKYKEALRVWTRLDLNTRLGLTEVSLVDVAIARACTGDLTEALSELRLARSDMRARHVGAGGSFTELIATMLFVDGKKSEAKTECLVMIDCLKRRSIIYADGAGGVWPALLLFAFCEFTNDEAGVATAIMWMQNRSKRARYKNWPGPLCDLVMQKQTLDEVHLGEFKEARLDALIQTARSDIYTRKCLISSLFYGSVVRRRAGDARGSHDLMQMCATLENTHLEPEWYLARHTMGMGFWWKLKQQNN